MTEREQLIALALLRVAVGTGLLVVPRLTARGWVGGKVLAQPGAAALARGMGARDLALGLGTLLAIEQGKGVRNWVEAGALSDLGDTVATLLAWRRLPRAGRLLALASAGAAAAVGFRLAGAPDVA